MKRFISLSDDKRALLIKIAEALEITSQELQDNRLENRDPLISKEFIMSYINNAEDEMLVLIYILLIFIEFKSN